VRSAGQKQSSLNDLQHLITVLFFVYWSLEVMPFLDDAAFQNYSGEKLGQMIIYFSTRLTTLQLRLML
jgi:hypothetical protein